MAWKRPDPEPDTPISPPQPTSAAPARPGPPTRGERAVLGASIRVQGDLTGEEDLLIQGQVEGTVDLGQYNVNIGEQGRVKADVRGRVISIEGQVEGNLYGQEQVILRKSGRVQGNIVAPRLTLEDGSKFKGSIDMEPGTGSGNQGGGKGGEKAGGGASRPGAPPTSGAAGGSPPSYGTGASVAGSAGGDSVKGKKDGESPKVSG